MIFLVLNKYFEMDLRAEEGGSNNQSISFIVLPTEGNLNGALCVVAYLQQKLHSRLAYNQTYSEIDYSSFKEYD